MKETPNVKILDFGQVPERKSFPPRLLIMLLCSLLVSVGAAGFVLLSAMWDRVDGCDPRKAFVQEIFHAVQARMLSMSGNGTRLHTARWRVWTRVARHAPPASSEDLEHHQEYDHRDK